MIFLSNDRRPLGRTAFSAAGRIELVFEIFLCFGDGDLVFCMGEQFVRLRIKKAVISKRDISVQARLTKRPADNLMKAWLIPV